MKQILVVAIALIATVNSYGQETTSTVKTDSKFDLFTSKFGTIVKFTDYPVENFRRGFGKGTTAVRVVTNGGNESRYYMKITNEGQYSTSTAVIEYSDILEILKAMVVLKESESKDQGNPNYSETKFRTSDGFEIGYYVSSGKIVWYLKLEKIGRDTIVFPNGTSSEIEQVFIGAKNKIEELKK